MKYILYLILITTLNYKSCSKSVPTVNDKKKIILISAFSENWIAGIQGGGSGTEYYFKIKINTSQKITFDTAWINNRKYATYITKERKSISSQPITYTQGDTITVRVSHNSRSNSTTDTLQWKPPIPLKGAALIRYTANTKINYLDVPEIKKQKTVNRP